MKAANEGNNGYLVWFFVPYPCSLPRSVSSVLFFQFHISHQHKMIA